MEAEEIKILLDKYIAGTCTPAERSLLENWYNQDRQQYVTELDEDTIQSDLQYVYAQLPKPVRAVKLPWSRIAAMFFLILGSGLFYFHEHSSSNQLNDNQYNNDITPGKNTATLTLANGKSIVLSTAVKGKLAEESGITITKSADGQLVYEIKDLADQGTDGNNSVYNTLSTARAEHYEVKLPDGTKVWLNAASSLRYPVQFVQNQRRVELTGEGYFEVAKDKLHPFVVKTNGQEVEVLGTHFNISSYADEPSVKTTLLEGSVKVNQNTILKPGEQSILTASSIRVVKADTEDAVAWKNDQFSFQQENLQSIMRKISRWYAVDISYDGGEEQYKDLEFGGFVSRTKNISEVLKIMQRTNKIHFKIDGKKITVTK